MSGTMKDRLLNRERPVAVYPCRVASVEDTQAAESALAMARKVAMGVKETDKAAARKAKKVLEDAEAKRDACYVKIRLRAMEPKEFEALSDVYPPAPDDANDDTKKTADEAYLHAVFLGSVEDDGSMSEQDWTDFIHHNVGTSERNDIYNMGIAINGRVRALDPATPKGLTATRG